MNKYIFYSNIRYFYIDVMMVIILMVLQDKLVVYQWIRVLQIWCLCVILKLVVLVSMVYIYVLRVTILVSSYTY